MNGTTDIWQCDECGLRVDVPTGANPMPFYRCARCKGGHFTKVPTTIMSVAQSFASYQAEVIPAGSPTIQIEECRRAFYAGAYFLLMQLATAITEDTPDEEGIAALEELKTECETFAANLKPGYSKGRPDAG